MTSEELVQRLSNEATAKRDAIAKAKRDYDQMVIDGANDNKRSAARKAIAELKHELEDIGIRLLDAREKAANEARALSRKEQTARLDDAAKKLGYAIRDAGAVVSGIVSLSEVYHTAHRSLLAAYTAFRAAGLKDSAAHAVLTDSLDLLIFVEFARAGIGHLAETKINGAANYLPLEAAIEQRLQKVDVLIEKARAALNETPAPKQTTVAELHARVAAG